MRDDARVQTVIDLLQQAAEEPRPTDTLLSAAFRQNRFIGSKDRAAIAQLFYDCQRHYARISWWQHKLGIKASARNFFLLYFKWVEGESLEGLATLFSGEKFAPLPLQNHEEAFLEKLEGETYIHADMDKATQVECPNAVYEKFANLFGVNIKEECLAMLEPAPLDLRVNSLKATRAEAIEKLEKEGVFAKPTPFSPWGLRVTGRPALAQTKVFKDGLVEIQDEGSQLVALCADVKKGQSVVDFCAGAGGKTLALAALMENKGRLVACDVLDRRLQRAKLRFRRAGAHNIEIHALKNENDAWVKRGAGKYDCVLVDAPCSGTGTWRRNPDERWKQLGPELKELIPLQARILQSAARLVKAGGRLVYATCSLLPDENEKQIDDFVNANKEFSVAAIPKIAENISGDFLKLTPAQHGTDGFFAAVLEKKKD